MRPTAIGAKLLLNRPFFARPAVRIVPALLAATAFVLAGVLAEPADANPRYAALVTDVKTGKTIFSRSADSLRYPASLTKMMTLYVLFEELDRGRFTMDSQFEVSKFAAGKPPSKIGVRPGTTIAVRDAIPALAIKSANDVAAVIAENVSGSESAFAQRMTDTARALGMKKTTFKNASGLPHPGQKTTARDMARLGLALQDRFPHHFEVFEKRRFTYKGRTYRNHNRLVGGVPGVNGIKTGYIRASGFNLVTSYERHGRQVIAVVMGGRSSASRNAHMRTLLSRHTKKASNGVRRTALALPPGASVAVARAPTMPRGRPGIALASVAAPIMPIPPLGMADTAPIPEIRVAYAPDRASPPKDFIAETIISAVNSPHPSPADVKVAREIAIEKLIAIKSEGFAPDTELDDEKPAVAVPNGWHVQVGASPSRSGAQNLLDKAKGKSALLASAESFTQPVEKGGSTLYRARFGGFDDKEAARAACASLKKNNVDCLAVPN